MVTPTYYVYFTSTTIITSAILFQGFKGTPTAIVTVVMGFLTICAGVVLLQLSKSAKDVPDTAVFAGNLDQIQTIAEQEQPESEPKADAIRGAAAIVRRFSVARQKMEVEELKKLHDEKVRERLEPVSENGQPEYEWDGLRRRKTIYGTQRGRSMTSPNPFVPAPETPHPPLGMSHFPTEEELEADRNRPMSPGVLESIAGTIRTRAKSVLVPGQPGAARQGSWKVQSPMHPVQLTEISVPAQKTGEASDSPYFDPQAAYGLPGGKTEYEGSGASVSSARRVQFGGDNRQASQGSAASSQLGPAPTPPPHGPGSAKRQFSFQNILRRGQQHPQTPQQQAEQQANEASQRSQRSNRPGITARGYSNPQTKNATEEERLGLVKGDSHSMPSLPRYDDDDDLEEEDGEDEPYADDKLARYGRGITNSPPRQAEKDNSSGGAGGDQQRGRGGSGSGQPGSRGQGSRTTPPPPPRPQRRHSPPDGGDGGAFI
jgi:magnesium transporter